MDEVKVERDDGGTLSGCGGGSARTGRVSSPAEIVLDRRGGTSSRA